MEREISKEVLHRLDVGRFIELYRMANEELPEAIGIEFDDFVCEGAIRELRRQDVIALYRGLAEADSSQLRGIAAQGAYNVVRIDPTEGLRLLNELRTDADPQVALQAEETLHDLPELLAGSS